MNDETIYTDEDLGKHVETIIEGIRYYDEIIECYLPDGQRIVGPRLKCAHLFARYSMIPHMEAVSEATQKSFRDGL